MKRAIVDYSKLTNEVLDLLVERFPDGYGDDDIITFQNAKGETVKAIEVRSSDTIYLVKIGLKLSQKMEDYADDTDNDNDDDTDNDYDSDDFDPDEIELPE